MSSFPSLRSLTCPPFSSLAPSFTVARVETSKSKSSGAKRLILHSFTHHLLTAHIEAQRHLIDADFGADDLLLDWSERLVLHSGLTLVWFAFIVNRPGQEGSGITLGFAGSPSGFHSVYFLPLTSDELSDEVHARIGEGPSLVLSLSKSKRLLFVRCQADRASRVGVITSSRSAAAEWAKVQWKCVEMESTFTPLSLPLSTSLSSSPSPSPSPSAEKEGAESVVKIDWSASLGLYGASITRNGYTSEGYWLILISTATEILLFAYSCPEASLYPSCAVKTTAERTVVHIPFDMSFGRVTAMWFDSVSMLLCLGFSTGHARTLQLTWETTSHATLFAPSPLTFPKAEDSQFLCEIDFSIAQIERFAAFTLIRTYREEAFLFHNTSLISQLELITHIGQVTCSDGAVYFSLTSANCQSKRWDGAEGLSLHDGTSLHNLTTHYENKPWAEPIPNSLNDFQQCLEWSVQKKQVTFEHETEQVCADKERLIRSSLLMLDPDSNHKHDPAHLLCSSFRVRYQEEGRWIIEALVVNPLLEVLDHVFLIVYAQQSTFSLRVNTDFEVSVQPQSRAWLGACFAFTSQDSSNVNVPLQIAVSFRAKTSATARRRMLGTLLVPRWVWIGWECAREVDPIDQSSTCMRKRSFDCSGPHVELLISFNPKLSNEEAVIQIIEQAFKNNLHLSMCNEKSLDDPFIHFESDALRLSCQFRAIDSSTAILLVSCHAPSAVHTIHSLVQILRQILPVDTHIEQGISQEQQKQQAVELLKCIEEECSLCLREHDQMQEALMKMQSIPRTSTSFSSPSVGSPAQKRSIRNEPQTQAVFDMIQRWQRFNMHLMRICMQTDEAAMNALNIAKHVEYVNE